MNERPLVSILIPCYSHEQFLDDCLSSILAQEYENIEILICDDCSPDRSFEKICAYEAQLRERFSRVEIMRNETNCGVTCNVNRMLKLAKGTYIKTLASDDAMAPTAISDMVSYLEEHPEMDVVVSNGIKVPEQQHYPQFKSDEKIFPEEPDYSQEGFFERVARCNQISAPAAMVRMSVYQTYGFYDETVKVEDYEFWLRILKDGKSRIGFMDKAAVFYRINANSMSSMSVNEGLARRRKLFHDSEIGSLNKYRAYFEPAAYADIVLGRILAERWLAIEYRLEQWESELHRSWNAFPYWSDLPREKRIRLHIANTKQSVKKLLRWYLLDRK